MSRSARLTDDVLADIQGFITSGYGHLSRAAYSSFSFRMRDRRGGGCGACAGDHVRAPVADGARRREDQAAGGAEHRLHRRRPRALSACHRRCCARFPRSSRKASRARTDREILGDTEESDPVEWELGGTEKPPIHAVVVIHAASAAGLEAACHAQRTLLRRHGGRCRRAARQHAERIPARRRSRAVRVSRRHRPAIDRRNHRRRRAHRRVHSRVSEPLRDRSTDAGRARGTGPRKRSCLRWRIPITHRSGCGISASTAPTSCIESSSRTSQGSGSS